jgi:hypothetical protein
MRRALAGSRGAVNGCIAVSEAIGVFGVNMPIGT